jgi:hypothetical protein
MMAKRPLSVLILRKSVGSLLLWGTVGLISLQSFFFVIVR